MRTLFSVLLDITTTPFSLSPAEYSEYPVSGSQTPAVKMADSQSVPPCKLHRLFRVYDPEVVAVMTILLGLFQMLLGLPTYYMSLNIKVLHLCPVFVGAVFVAGGAFAMACERTPNRQLMKTCVYASAFGLLVGLCAIIVYAYAVNDIKSVEVCDHNVVRQSGCQKDEVIEYFISVSALLLIYDIGALTLQGLILFSAMKGLKTS
ncbi:uncharacterized protein si:dkey-9i23.16 [Tachysurus fulvidraco]|uniref:uncharacterized protein si:dkey-9i23.16 n=1 Tax=Tachysurus fulvidraco TaxID=1234273 RepID=UPI000F507CC4|nr:uncharacterized protein si:dkey-9i23.16 [Tachysurus fulvidraco]